MADHSDFARKVHRFERFQHDFQRAVYPVAARSSADNWKSDGLEFLFPDIGIQVRHQLIRHSKGVGSLNRADAPVITLDEPTVYWVTTELLR